MITANLTQAYFWLSLLIWLLLIIIFFVVLYYVIKGAVFAALTKHAVNNADVLEEVERRIERRSRGDGEPSE